jgi:hypothetical protein
MASSLKRLLRIRAMQEAMARSGLEAETARLRALERGAAAAAGEALGSRARWFAAVGREEAGAVMTTAPERTAEEWAWELAVWRRGQSEARQPAQRAEVGRAQTVFLDGRRERMQVASLVEAAKDVERINEARAEQRRLDDWYRSRKQPGAETAEPAPERVGENRLGEKRRRF